MVHGEDLFVYLSDFGSQILRRDLQLRNNIDQRIDTAFQLEKFVQYHHLFLLKYTISALEVASFIANDVFSLIQHSFNLIKCRLCVLHFNRKGNKYWSCPSISPFDFIHRGPAECAKN